MFVTDLQTRRAGLSASAELLVKVIAKKTFGLLFCGHGVFFAVDMSNSCPVSALNIRHQCNLHALTTLVTCCITTCPVQLLISNNMYSVLRSYINNNNNNNNANSSNKHNKTNK